MHKLVKSAAAWSAGAALALASFVGATLPADADGAATCTSLKVYSTVKAGMAGARPSVAECLLADAGFAASLDAAFGDDDASAAKAFQESIGLPSTGDVDRGTWTALLSRGSTPTLKSGSKGADVKRLQTALRAAGYSKVTSSGTFGTKTKTAVKGVQKSQHWRQTGTATAGVWTALQSGAKVTVMASKAKKKAKKKASSTRKGRKALAFAKRQLGDSYRYGAEGPNAWDCSGLTKKAWAAAGVKLPHSARGQYGKGKRVSKSNLRKGDLVFFYSGISHVAIYAGNGKVIHASRPGSPVSYIKMKYMPYVGAVRPG